MEQQLLQEITTVPKEMLSEIRFAKEDVLKDDPVRLRMRNIYLAKAQTIGNLYKHKVKIFFQTELDERMAVETTIWSADEHFVSLKNATIPTRAIWALQF